MGAGHVGNGVQYGGRGSAERFALWEETTTQSHMRNRLHSDDREDFRARMRVVDFGEMQVSALAYSHLGIARTAKLIRQSDPEVYLINFYLGREGLVSAGRADTGLRTGDLVVLGSSRPCHGDCGGRRAEMVRPRHSPALGRRRRLDTSRRYG
ncbi:AraC-like ligand-binding domain-containing protein [Streptomyces sp. BRA346]|uniref:AraC-like ligand-binding domain-containing protein n=1 Tax=Streptomyces sp. BRA346 TaxID=2878199 RepID=UPI00406397A4